jgi:hypothetical protein
MSAFMLVQTFYWLALATWFGGVLFIAVSAPVILRTVRESKVILPNVLSVNLEDQHGSLLSGHIVGNILRKFASMQFGCAGILLAALALQWLVMDLSTANKLHAIIRSSIFIAALVLAIYHRWMIWPKVWKHRQEYVEHADEPDLANPANEQFNHYQSESTLILFIITILLSLMIVFSSTITPRGL